MNIDWVFLSQFGDFIGGVATLLALVTILYVLQQTREMSRQNQIGAKSALINIYKEISSVMLEIDKIFLENPDIPVVSLLTPPLHEVLPLPLKISFGQKIMNKIAHMLWNRKVKKGMAFGLADYSKIHSTFCPLIYIVFCLIQLSIC